MGKIYNSAAELIGRTPMLRLSMLENKIGACAKIYGKLEYFNPAGSVKDRVALEMINGAEARGVLKKGSVIIEPTSGNTGIGIAAVAAARGYRVIIVMPETMSEERKKLMRAYGAELILTDGALGMRGSIEKAEELAKNIENSFIAGQFTNPANPEAHRKTTGPEIFEDMDGEVDMLVAGVGTGGTITGTGSYLKEKIPNIRIVAVEPASSAVLSGKASGAHGLQGIGAGFVPAVLDTTVYDEIVAVTEAEAYEAARALGKCEGVLVGISSGAALFAACELAKREENKDKKIVVILPDSGDRYLSTDLY